MVDDVLKPWLIEVNASPSLSASTKSDRVMKENIMDDVLKIVFPDDRLSKNIVGVNNCEETSVGNFVCIYDERNEIINKNKGK